MVAESSSSIRNGFNKSSAEGAPILLSSERR
jgi:hypothetical protein